MELFLVLLKSARLVVLHKVCSRDDPSNRRPVSLLSAFSKIVEKCMYSKLMSFLDKEKHFLMSDKRLTAYHMLSYSPK